MTLEEALAVFRANDGARDDSFLDGLHEHGRFDLDRFWRFCNAAIVVGASPHRLDQEIRDGAFAMHDYILRAMIWHYRGQGGDRIEGMPDDPADCLDVLSWALSGILRGRISPWAHPPVENPRAAELAAHFKGEDPASSS